MESGKRLVLIPRFTTLKGADDSATTIVTQPTDAADLGPVEFEMGRGPIESAAPGHVRFEISLEESPDGKTWCRLPEGVGMHDSRGEVSGRFLHALRFRWIRARVEFQGRSVTCWAEGTALG